MNAAGVKLRTQGAVTPDQCREARRLLGWSQCRLAEAVGTRGICVSNFERTGFLAKPRSGGDRRAALRSTLEAAGAEFYADGKSGVAVRTPPGRLVSDPAPITPEQMRQARALLDWSRSRLAARSETTAEFVRAYEVSGRVQAVARHMRETDRLAAIRAAFEAAGSEFTNDDPPGVKLRKLDR